MKTIRAFWRWLRGYQLSQRDSSRLSSAYDTAKVFIITVVIGLILVWFCNVAGCYEGKYTDQSSTNQQKLMTYASNKTH